jgi:hypothetical protein
MAVGNGGLDETTGTQRYRRRVVGVVGVCEREKEGTGARKFQGMVFKEQVTYVSTASAAVLVGGRSSCDASPDALHPSLQGRPIW